LIEEKRNKKRRKEKVLKNRRVRDSGVEEVK
jgi:hypothetical protein